MPGPVSLTATVKLPFAWRALILISPLSVNLSALPTRFNSTCARRRSSPRACDSPAGTSSFTARPLVEASGSTAAKTPCTMSRTE